MIRSIALRSLAACAVAGALVAANAASARNTFHDLDVKAAKESRHAETLRDVPVYMAGEKHPKIAKSIGEFTTNQRTNAFNKTDEDACNRVFISALIQLQDRAKTEGGDAVVDVKSITKHNDLTSATQFRCVAGAMVANVALTGRVVKLAPPEAAKPAKKKK
jgi:uncharacterized protein YbjQ (UPF0145 family)